MKKLTSIFAKGLAGKFNPAGPFIIAVDGRCAAGKTTFAARLAARLGADIVHTDDFFLPFEKRAPGALKKPAGHMNIKRLKREVLVPAVRGRGIKFKPYGCADGKFLKTVKIKPRRFLIVEGSYSLHPLLAPYYDYKIFLTVTPALQTRRLIKREGKKRAEIFKKIWIPAEELFFDACSLGLPCKL